MILRIVFLLLFLFCLPLDVYSQEDQFELEAKQFGLIEQTLLNQAIENDPQIKELDNKLQRLGTTTSIGRLSSSSMKSAIRIVALSSRDSSVHFITNGINLGADTIGIFVTSYELYKTKRLRNKLEKRVKEIKNDLLDIFSKLETSRVDIDAKNSLISLVGKKSTNEYMNWLEVYKNR